MKREILKLLEKTLKKLAEKEKFDFKANEIEVTYPKSEIFGDYTTNLAMILAKKIKRNPMKIAEEMIGLIEKPSQNFKKIEAVKPGYINFYLSEKYLQNKVGEINDKKEKFGDQPDKKKVMVEYSQPNTHKEFHIGHLRNVFIGNSLVNVLRKGDNNIISANYIGDTGTHIAKCLWGITKFHSEEDLEAVKNKAEFLGKVYSEAVNSISENPEYEKEFKNLQKKFENGDEDLTKLWKKTKQWSLDEFQKIYDELGVSFDVYFWESEEEDAGKKILPELLKKEFIKKSQGAIIADLEEYKLGVLVLVRKDGSVLYGLKDISLAIKKFDEYRIEKSINVVDIRQELYFKQIYKVLELLGVKGKSQHIGYDFVSLKGSETMSSRKGNIISAEVLIEKITEKVKEKFPETVREKEIALGALKFYMLKYSAKSKIEFDMDEAIRLDGATGPYVQYAHARISSIIAKHKTWDAKYKINKKVDFSLLTQKKEIILMRELNKFPELIEEIAQTYNVHKLSYYAIKLADKFHSFYNDIKVLDEENLPLSEARLELVKAVKIVLAEVLRLMGISAPESM